MIPPPTSKPLQSKVKTEVRHRLRWWSQTGPALSVSSPRRPVRLSGRLWRAFAWSRGTRALPAWPRGRCWVSWFWSGGWIRARRIRPQVSVFWMLHTVFDLKLTIPSSVPLNPTNRSWEQTKGISDSCSGSRDRWSMSINASLLSFNLVLTLTHLPHLPQASNSKWGKRSLSLKITKMPIYLSCDGVKIFFCVTSGRVWRYMCACWVHKSHGLVNVSFINIMSFWISCQIKINLEFLSQQNVTFPI